MAAATSFGGSDTCRSSGSASCKTNNPLHDSDDLPRRRCVFLCLRDAGAAPSGLVAAFAEVAFWDQFSVEAIGPADIARDLVVLGIQVQKPLVLVAYLHDLSVGYITFCQE